MGLCPLRLPTQVQLFSLGHPIWFAFFAFPWACDQICACSWNLGSGRLSFPHRVYFIKKSTISESSDECVIWDSSTAQESADVVKPFFVSLVAPVSDSYFAFAVRHSHDCLYKEDKLAWQRRSLYFSTDWQIIWRYGTLYMQNHYLNPVKQYLMVACVF